MISLKHVESVLLRLPACRVPVRRFIVTSCIVTSCRGASFALFFVIVMAGTSCGLLSSPRPSGLASTPVGTTLDKLWAAYGGIDAWRRHGKACASMVVVGEPHGQKLERTIRFCTDRWNVIEAGSGGDLRELDLVHQYHHFDPDDPRSAEDYHLRAARFFFHLPFAISDTRWRFRLDVIDGSDSSPHQFWAMPGDLPSPHLGYYLFVNPDSGLLDRVVYQVSHPRFAGRIFSVEFKDYRWINGIQIATAMRHSEAAASRVKTGGQPVPSSSGSQRPSMATRVVRFNEVTFEEGACEEPAEEEVPAT